ncbi:hypothetical protein [Bifidobacterium eulemuris]|uniref:GTPase regulator-like protein n=1 Tax=Bifidobacterium eulemuris TaxID=1765219 RepID=A0A261G3I5_9BIFI|nr:hypothetical protein [Bifidobacterium eulemuris]OZG65991.1 hypothetical protein BEUL_1889 [Bifidobacterium eulemuris]
MSVEEQENADAKRPTRHAMFMRGVVTPIFGLLAVAAVVLGVMNATVWKPSAQIEASTRVSGTRYIITDPGVLPLVDSDVRVNVEASDSSQEVCVALGSAKDVVGWLSGNDYTRVTGLTDWTELSTQETGAQGDAADESDSSVAFEDSDMWTDVSCDTGSVSVRARDAGETQVAIIDLGEESGATVSLDWTRQNVPDFAMPFYFVGGLCVIFAVLSASVFAMDPSKRRKSAKKAAEAAASGASGVSGAAEGVGVAAAAASATAEEVTIGAAVAGTLSTSAASVSKMFSGKKSRRRHARHGGGATVASESPAAPATPTIVDPTARNLVADQQNGAVPPSDGAILPDSNSESLPADAAATSVISTDELQAYFARLAQEVGGVEESAAPAGGSAGTGDAPDPSGTESDQSEPSGTETQEEQ